VGVAIVAVTLLLALVACSDDSSKTSGPAPSPSDLANAQVIGAWKLALTVDSLTPPALDPNVKQGDKLTRLYDLGRGCNVDTTDCKVVRDTAAGKSDEIWTRAGPTLTYSAQGPVTVSCNKDGTDTPVDYIARATFTLTVTDAIQVGDQWVATDLAYTRKAELVPSGTGASVGCPSGTQVESGTAVPTSGTASPNTSAAPNSSTAPSVTPTSGP